MKSRLFHRIGVKLKVFVWMEDGVWNVPAPRDIVGEAPFQPREAERLALFKRRLRLETRTLFFSVLSRAYELM